MMRARPLGCHIVRLHPRRIVTVEVFLMNDLVVDLDDPRRPTLGSERNRLDPPCLRGRCHRHPRYQVRCAKWSQHAEWSGAALRNPEHR